MMEKDKALAEWGKTFGKFYDETTEQLNICSRVFNYIHTRLQDKTNKVTKIEEENLQALLIENRKQSRRIGTLRSDLMVVLNEYRKKYPSSLNTLDNKSI